MAIQASELRTALKLVYEQSGEGITYEGIEDFDCLEDDLLNRVIADGKLELWCPGEDSVEWPLDEFVRYVSECDSISEGKEISLRTKTLALQIVSPVNDMAHAVTYHKQDLLMSTRNGVTVHMNHRCLPVGVFAVRHGFYHSDFGGPFSQYPTIEIDFSAFQAEKTDKVEADIVEAYLFELVSSHDILFQKASFISFDDDEPEWTSDKWAKKRLKLKFRPLVTSNEGVRLYLAAAQVSDPSLRFFSFYKVLEYFAPTALNLETHEALRRKLHSSDALAPAGQFIREVLQLSKSFDQRKNDRDLIKGVLLTAVDLPGLNLKVPTSLRRTITYESARKDLEQYARDLAESICATRNQVAHAKTTYESHGTECPPVELAHFTDFLASAAAEVIRWYAHLPDHQKSELA